MIQDERRGFDEKITELAADLTYDEFVQIAMSKAQNKEGTVLDLWKVGDSRFVSTFDPLYPGDSYLCVITRDKDLNEGRIEEEYPDYNSYALWDFERDKVHMVHALYWDMDLFHTPPTLWEKKKLIDRELRPLDYASRDDSVRRSGRKNSIYIQAEQMIKGYDLSCINNETEWFYFKNKHNGFNPVIIMGIDFYRGMDREQRIIADLVKKDCEADSRIIFQLWDTDAGFETLKNQLSDYEQKGRVLYERSRYKENFSGEVEDD